MKPPLWRQERAVYPHVFSVQTRYRDEDRLGHVNNIAIAEYYDEARSRFTRQMFVTAGMSMKSRIVTADSRLTYLAEVFHLDDVKIGTGILRIGTSSYDIGQGLFVDGVCKGLCTTTFVQASATGATPLSEALRAALDAMELQRPALETAEA